MQALFWIAAAVVVYTYLGYGLLLLLVNRLLQRKKPTVAVALPAITFIVPAYNEADIIEAKISNTLGLSYPPGKITYLFITDGSDDGTENIVAGHPQITLLHQPERKGKSVAINRAMVQVTTPVVVFSDANTFVQADSLLKLVAHFANAAIGGVSGEKQIAHEGASAVGVGERLYWKYESQLKQANANFYTLVGAAGELFAIRTALFQPLKEDVILDDFFISATVCLQGYRFVYEREAVAVETSSADMQEEQKRKVRISAGCYQAFARLGGLLNPFRHRRLTFQYASHRVLRWVVCPLALPLLFATSFLLYREAPGSTYAFLFWSQCGFYALAAAGRIFTRQFRPLPFLLVPYYFVFMIASQYRGFWRFATGRQPAVWEKAQRRRMPQNAPANVNRQRDLPLGNK